MQPWAPSPYQLWKGRCQQEIVEAARCLVCESFTGDGPCGRARAFGTFPAAGAGRGRSRQGKEQAGKGAGRLRSHPAPPPLGKGRASLESLTQLYHHQKHNSPLMIITGFPAALLFRGAGAFLVAIGAV